VPRRASPGHAARIERALSPGLRAALLELRELLDVDAGWQATPLGPPFVTAACILRAAQMARTGAAPGEALLAAAREMDLEPDTIKSRVARWSERSRVHIAPAKKRPGVASLVRDAAQTPPRNEAA